jgi:HAD superfamily hydrolase (TIGR01549 family)
MINTIIFDVGGTLLEAPDPFMALSNLYPDESRKKEIQLELQESILSNYQRVAYGEIEYMSIETIVSNTLKSTAEKLDIEDKSGYAREILYQVFLEHAMPVEGLNEILEYCKTNHIEMYIASDADIPLLHLELEKFGIAKYFRRCFISDELKAYKPSDAFVEAIRSVLSAGDEAIFVGDSEADLLSGEKLGIRTVYLGKNEPRSKPTYRVNTLGDLIDLLKNEMPD